MVVLSLLLLFDLLPVLLIVRSSGKPLATFSAPAIELSAQGQI